MSLAFAACRPAAEDGAAKAEPTSIPEKLNDVTGIWRTVHQGVLELRANRDFVLISPVTKPDSGKYTLGDGRLTFQADVLCPGVDGFYAVRVTRSKRMALTSLGDTCAPRQRVLVTDPFVYVPRSSN